jgi:hypothetical protein
MGLKGLSALDNLRHVFATNEDDQRQLGVSPR